MFDNRIVGYSALMAPEQNFWKANFIFEGLRTQAEKAIADARALSDAHNIEIEPFPGLSESDSKLAGAIAAMYADTMLRGMDAHVAVAAHAIKLLINRPYFYVEAFPTAGGIKTRVMALPMLILTPEGGRAYIRSLPIVAEIERRSAAARREPLS